MTATRHRGELERIGLLWHPSGQAGLRGPLLRLAEDCDTALRRLAAIWSAQEERHPASLPAAVVERADYLRAFPHQATFPMGMDRDEAALDEFLAGPVLDEAGHVALGRLAPVSDVLTPAACYHLYGAHQGESLDAALYLTTRNTCFRRESRYQPLRRLSSFTMREIVCVGTPAEASGFLDEARGAVDRFLALADLPVEWLTATDPFFRPQSSPQYLFQRINPTKHEATYGGDLAIASANLHQDHFGRGFELRRGGEAAHSACVAFGIERWLHAVTDRHGTDPASWPDLPGAAETVAERTRAAAEGGRQA